MMFSDVTHAFTIMKVLSARDTRRMTTGPIRVCVLAFVTAADAWTCT